jgi:surface antigen
LQNTVSGKQLQPATSLNAVSKPTISPSAIFVPNAHPGPVSRSPFQDQSCAQASNCVLFLRDCAHANMPHTDLTYWNQKMAIRNVFDPNSPKVGDVAIIQITSGPYAQNGHVAEVSSVNSDGTITIQEANYPNVGFEYRTGTPAQLNIAGYYDGSK